MTSVTISPRFIIGLLFSVTGIIVVIALLMLLSKYSALIEEDYLSQENTYDDTHIERSIENIINLSSVYDEILTPKVRQPTPEEAEKYPQLTNLPTLYITLNDDVSFSSITKEEYIAGTYTLVYGEEGGIYDEPIFVKGRGAYSWSNPKRPYTVKLGKPTDLLGMNKARKWVLMADYVDKTMLRTYLTFKLARDISQGIFSPDSRYVDAYFNGQYNGLYYILDSIQVYENRINIDIEHEALFEIEAIYRHDNHRNCIDMRNGGHHILYKKPDDNDIFREVKEANLVKFQEFFDNFHTALDKGYNEFSKYMNVESFVNWYIVNELVKNFDSAFTASCYCYIKDGKLHMGPVWDYHTCYGGQEVATCRIPTGYHVRTSPWFSKLMDDETFFKLVCERWTELRKEGVIDDFLSQIPGVIDNMSDSIEKNFILWRSALRETGLRGRARSFFTFEEEVDYLVNWTLTRIEWLDKQWYIDD